MEEEKPKQCIWILIILFKVIQNHKIIRSPELNYLNPKVMNLGVSCFFISYWFY